MIIIFGISKLVLFTKGRKYKKENKKKYGNYRGQLVDFTVDYQTSNKWKNVYNYNNFNGKTEEICYSKNLNVETFIENNLIYKNRKRW